MKDKKVMKRRGSLKKKDLRLKSCIQKPKRTFFIDDDLRNTLLTRQMACHMSYVDQVNPFPDEVEQLYHQLFPLEQTDHKSITFSPIQISTFRVNRRDGLQFCMKRIHGKVC